MKWFCFFCFVLLLFPGFAGAQQPRSEDDQPHIVPKNLPKEEPTPQPKGESSSKDSEVKLEDAGQPAAKPEDKSSQVQEMHPFDPHKAAKDVEVGQYYLRQKNYRAALDRFNEALLYKPNDADATFRLAQTQEKLELYAMACQNYQSYLNLLKDGPFAKDAQESIKRIEPRVPKAPPSGDLAEVVQQGEASLAKNDFETAQTSFAKAVEIAPDDAVANYRLAQSLKGLQRLDEARIYYQKYLSLQPGGEMAGDAKREIGRINYILGKP